MTFEIWGSIVKGLKLQLQMTGLYNVLVAYILEDDSNLIMANLLNSIIWFIILIVVSFWIAGFCAGLYIFVHPLSVCIPPLSGLSDFLLTVIQFPHYCAKKMMSGEPLG
ncbi:uncharacterized protein [Leptinotarsa decemlineata]|uniref:uncharacterized protein n=1 Tax=Leptinotarsa decemlineata TaxID=7539 RepID=UPI003D30A925